MAEQDLTQAGTTSNATPDPVVTDAVVIGAPTPVVAPAPTPPPEVAVAKTFTKAEVEEIVRTRISRERNEKLQTPPPVEPAKAPVAKAKASPASPSEPSSSEYRAFDRAVGKFEHLTDRQLEHVENEFLRVRPDKADTATFITDLVDGLFPKPTQPQAADATTKPPATPKEPGVTPDPNAIDNNAPGTRTTWQQVTDPSLLSSEMVAQIINEKGLRPGQRYIRNMAESWGKTVRVIPG